MDTDNESSLVSDFIGALIAVLVFGAIIAGIGLGVYLLWIKALSL